VEVGHGPSGARSLLAGPGQAGALPANLGCGPAKPYDERRPRIGELLHAVLALPAVLCDRAPVLHRTLELYEGGQHFTDAYLVATAEAENIPEIVSFDRGIRNVRGVRRIEP
jgi:predicted nucleic acid-binding protein